MSLNLPWKVEDLREGKGWDVFRVDGQVCFPWGIANRWGVIIGRFDTEQQAKQVVDAVNDAFAVHSQ